MLSGCLFQPGTFDATLHITADRQFTFSYQGEIVMASMSELDGMAQDAESESLCTDDENGKQRPCTLEERAERERNQAMSRQMLESAIGGVDLSSPESVEAMIATLESRVGWNSVEFIGEGVFVVDYAITSTLGHDFDFPTFDEMPVSNAFVQMRLRDDGRARISAPGFAPVAENLLGSVFMGMFGAFGQPQAEGGQTAPPAMMRHPEGRFRIITDAQILANNTEEGPVADPRGQVLVWDIDTSTSAPPSALIRFAD